MNTGDFIRMGLKLLAPTVLSIALAAAARANPIDISLAADAQKCLLGNDSTMQTNFDFLLTRIRFYNGSNGTNLLAPTMTGCGDESGNAVDLTGFSYAVVHYDRAVGQTHHDAAAFFYLNGMTGNYTFSANGLGHIFSIGLFSLNGVPVPEDGVTAILLGIAGLGLVTARRFVRA
jgi:hypothetical protein